MTLSFLIRYCQTAFRSVWPWVADAASLLLALARGCAEAPTRARALPKPFPLFRGHVSATLFHATTHIGASGTAPSQSAKEDSAQRQDSKRLPEGNLAPAEERRQQPIPQVLHYFAANKDKERHPQNCQRRHPNQFLPSRSHVQF